MAGNSNPFGSPHVRCAIPPWVVRAGNPPESRKHQHSAFMLPPCGSYTPVESESAACKVPPRKQSGGIQRVGIFLDSVRLTTRMMHPHRAYVRRAKQNRTDFHWGEIEQTLYADPDLRTVRSRKRAVNCFGWVFS